MVLTATGSHIPNTPVPGLLDRYVSTGTSGSRSLYVGSEEFVERYTQANEPEDNYCGPTALANLYYWYGRPVSYSIAIDLKTNDWGIETLALKYCTASCTFLGIPDPGCVTTCYAAVKTYGEVGTLPKDMERVLRNNAPPGFKLVVGSGTGRVGDILDQLFYGNPVVALLSEGRNLHWVTITGAYVENGVLKLRIANGADRTLSEFLSDWSLNNLGSLKKAFIEDELNVRPYTMYHYAHTQGRIYSKLSSIVGSRDQPPAVSWTAVSEGFPDGTVTRRGN
jgi:hypothetical protein